MKSDECPGIQLVRDSSQSSQRFGEGEVAILLAEIDEKALAHNSLSLQQLAVLMQQRLRSHENLFQVRL